MPCRDKYAFVDENGYLHGFDIDVIKYLAHEIGARLEVVEVSESTKMQGLIDGKYDILIGAYKDSTAGMISAREKPISFSAAMRPAVGS